MNLVISHIYTKISNLRLAVKIVILLAILSPFIVWIISSIRDRQSYLNNKIINLPCSKVEENQKKIESTIARILSGPDYNGNNYYKDSYEVTESLLVPRGIIIMIARNEIYFTEGGGEFEKIKAYSYAGTRLSSCSNTWAIGNMNNQSDPSCKIPSGAIFISDYFEKMKSNCIPSADTKE